MPANVFGHVRPKLAVFTTPNIEFNPLFAHFEGSFRHWDHRFEWTRAQFREWADSVVAAYPDYALAEITGVGEGKPEDGWSQERHGYCSQMAVFVRKDFEAALQERFDLTGKWDEEPIISEEDYK